MELSNNMEILISKEEGLALLNTWEHTLMEGMKCYGDTSAYLRVGNILRKLKDNIFFVRVRLEDYLAFSINLITNPNLMDIDKIKENSP